MTAKKTEMEINACECQKVWKFYSEIQKKVKR